MMRTSVPGSNPGHLSKTAVDQIFRAPMNRSKSAYFASVLGSRRLLLVCRSLCWLVSLGSAVRPSMSTSAPRIEPALDDSVCLEVNSCDVDHFDPARSTVGAFRIARTSASFPIERCTGV